MSERNDDLFAGLHAPMVPPGLEQRVLAAARDPRTAAMPRRIEDRIWDSRSLRAAWLAAASVLLAANLLLTGSSWPVDTERPSSAAFAAGPSFDVGIEIPAYRGETRTLGETDRLAFAMLDDPCLDPMSEGDCT
jgi:hypothetical protein